MGSIVNVGKYLFALPFLVFGIFHFMGADQMAAMAPGGKVMVYFTGVALIAAAVSIVIGKLDKLASILLALMLILFIVIIHVPAMSGAENESAQQMAMMSILKDLALAGGALLYAKQAKDNAIIG